MKSFVSVCCTIIGFVLAYVGSAFGKWPKIFYDPVGGTFQWQAPSSVVITYWGLWMWGIIGALVGLAIGLGVVAPLLQLCPRTATETATKTRTGLMSAWTLTALGFGVAYFAWHNWP